MRDSEVPPKKPASVRLWALVFVAVGACLLAHLSLLQDGAARDAQSIMDVGARMADTINELSVEGPNQLRGMAWQVSKEVYRAAKHTGLGWGELDRIDSLVSLAQAAATFESKRQLLEQIRGIVERRVQATP